MKCQICQAGCCHAGAASAAPEGSPHERRQLPRQHVAADALQQVHALPPPGAVFDSVPHILRLSQKTGVG